MSPLVYTTQKGSICPKCGWPVDTCQCSATRANEPVPQKVVAKLRMEKSGRGGKIVSVIYDLPNNSAFLKALCSELKTVCGTGGAVADNTIELQGDQRERLRGILQKKGFTVKG